MSRSLDPRQVHRLAHEGAEDFRLMASTSLQLSNEVADRWTIGCTMPPNDGFQNLSPALLQSRYHAALTRVETSTLERERLAGREWPDIDAFLTESSNESEHVRRRNELKQSAWHVTKGPMLEALCLLAILRRYSPSDSPKPVTLFERVGPLALVTNSSLEYLWIRPSLPSAKSGLRASPDIVITSTAELPTASNTSSIIECKCRRTLKANEIRAEFGKAYDLASPSYTLISYHSQPSRIRIAATSLGISFEIFHLHSPRRQEYLAGRRDLATDLSAQLQECQARRAFLAVIEGKNIEMQKKLMAGT